MPLSAAAPEWPEVMGKKAGSMGQLISRIVRGLQDSNEPLNEKHLWEFIAGNDSTEWQKARHLLREAENRIQHFQSDENVPLGLIGSALESDETTRAGNDYVEALASFTLIDEELRLDSELQRQFNALHAHWAMIEKSLQMAREVRALTRELEKLDTPPVAAGLTLRKVFGAFARNLTGKKTSPQGV